MLVVIGLLNIPQEYYVLSKLWNIYSFLFNIKTYEILLKSHTKQEEARLSKPRQGRVAPTPGGFPWFGKDRICFFHSHYRGATWRSWCLKSPATWTFYTPRNKVRGGGVYWIHPVCLSVCLSINLSCPPCSIYSSGGILFIFGTDDQ